MFAVFLYQLYSCLIKKVQITKLNIDLQAIEKRMKNFHILAKLQTRTHTKLSRSSVGEHQTDDRKF